MSRGSVHVALGEEGLRGAAATVNDFGEVADSLRVEAGFQSSERGGAATEKELYVGKELGHCFGLRHWGPGWGCVAGEEGVREGEAVVGPAHALAAECGRSQPFTRLEKNHCVFH